MLKKHVWYVFIWKDKSSSLVLLYSKVVLYAFVDVISTNMSQRLKSKCIVTQLVHFSSNSYFDIFFSTVDRDNDAWSKNCAERFSGAWWYSACHNSNLNGLYLRGEHESFGDGVNWYHWKGYHYSLKLTVLKIRGVRPKRRRRSLSDRL